MNVKDEVCGEKEEENCPGEGGRTEERNNWYLVRCYTVKGHIMYKIGLACTILYIQCTQYSVFDEFLGKITLRHVVASNVKKIKFFYVMRNDISVSGDPCYPRVC